MHKIGNNVWTIQEGWTKVIEIDLDSGYPVVTPHNSYTQQGLQYEQDSNPSLFTYDPLDGTEPPVEHIMGEFYKMQSTFGGSWFVAEWNGSVFETGGFHFEPEEVIGIVLMKEV